MDITVGSVVIDVELDWASGLNEVLWNGETAGNVNEIKITKSAANNLDFTYRKDIGDTVNASFDVSGLEGRHHLILTWLANGNAELYVDGSLKDSQAAAFEPTGIASTWYLMTTAGAGALYTTGKLHSLTGLNVQFTEAEAAQWYSEAAQWYSESLLERPTTGRAKKNFQIGDLYDRTEADNVGAWNMTMKDNVVADVSGDGNDLTLTGIASQEQGVGTTAMRYDGATGYHKATVANYRSGDTSGSVEGWVYFPTAGGNEFYFSTADEAGATRYFMVYKTATNAIALQNRNAGTVNTMTGDTTMPANQWIHVRMDSDGSNYFFYLNNTTETFTETSGADDGRWIGDIENRDNVVIGGLVRDAEFFADVKMDGILVRSAVPTAAVAEADYLKGARKLTYYNDFSDEPVTLGTSVSGGNIAGWHINSGTWKISEDSDGKWLECVTAGEVYIPLNQAYGTFEWDQNKSAGGITNVFLNATVIGSETASGQNGYNLRVNASEQIFTQIYTNGTPTNLNGTATATATAGTSETYRVTRSPAGVFTTYLNGTAVTTDSGTNPVTNTTYTSGVYLVVVGDAGDKFSNFKFRLGDVTPTQVP
jgi:hypothetical protein